MPQGLYGIEHSNRSNHCGKNCFNSSFPASLACWMHDRGINAVYAKLANIGGDLKIVCDQIPISEIFNCGSLRPSELEFDFETKYQPFEQYSLDSIDGIDLVVKDLEGHWLAPLEVKLTVLPDSTTMDKPEEDWGCELVIRPATTSYCVFSMWDKTKGHKEAIREIFEDTCAHVYDWKNKNEISSKLDDLRDILNTYEREYMDFQHPLVMQTFWKTKRQTSILCDRAFDIIAWSDYAFSRLFIDDASGRNVTRSMRAIARMARCLWELSRADRIRPVTIYRDMAFDRQTDKEFAISGRKWRTYIDSDRIINPAVPKDVIPQIIGEDIINNLHPERRFDQTLYFSYEYEAQND